MAEIVRFLQSKLFRLIAGEIVGRRAGQITTKTLAREHARVIPAYREMVDRAAELGVQVTIENDARNFILTSEVSALEFSDPPTARMSAELTTRLQRRYRERQRRLSAPLPRAYRCRSSAPGDRGRQGDEPGLDALGILSGDDCDGLIHIAPFMLSAIC
ncbi:hypothetical protein NKI89_29080 [Mesorhizobium sp. M0309]|uniref:hypothetical protein n=1 Tax=Mesorhizobium sp. M0309 TaxID=2956933 RepID=UPI00333707B3